MPTPNHTRSQFCYVYRIVCFPTGKVYVGSTNDAKKRENDHFKTLKYGTHHNQYLQHAYDKYGRAAFFFEVLERDIPADHINEREFFWIKHFDSFRNGFNATLGGEGKNGHGKPCVWNGVEYPTISDAAQACGVTCTAMIRRFKNGYTCDADMPHQRDNARKRPCTWNGVNYPSIKDAAKANGVKPITMRRRIVMGDLSDASMEAKAERDMAERRKHHPVWNGVQYQTDREAAEACGISLSAMRNRFKRGLTCDADMRRNRVK